MKIKQLGASWKSVFACFIVAMVCIIGTSVSVDAYESSKKKKDESCYLTEVKLKAADKEYQVKSSLKPFGVLGDINWSEFFGGMTVKGISAITNECEEDHYGVVAYILIDDQWRDLFTFRFGESIGDAVIDHANISQYNLTASYYDVKFTIWNEHEADYTSTVLYARFAKEYNVSYNLNGGKFDNNYVETYTTGSKYKLVNPVREGYEFVGWTGDGITEPTLNVYIAMDSSGHKLYTAVWKDSKGNIIGAPETNTGTPTDPGNQTTPEETTVAPSGDVTVNPSDVTSASKKLKAKKVSIKLKKVSGADGYKIEFSTTKKFKKVLITKDVKKVKVTITSKKLKNKKKLFARVRAYKANAYSEWSKVKKVTIK